MNGKPPKFTSPWKTTPSPQFDAKPIYRKEFAPPTSWLWGGFEMALYPGVYAEYMASIWLSGGFGWLWPGLATPGKGRIEPRNTRITRTDSELGLATWPGKSSRLPHLRHHRAVE